MIRTGRRLAPIVVAALLGLAACGSPSVSPSAEPARSGEPSGAATPTVAPSPTLTPSIDIFAPPGWVAITDVEPTILEEIRYHGYHNFLGRPVDGYLEPICVLPLQAAQALQRVQAAALAEGYTLKMYDCYRPARAGADFVAWGSDPSDEATRAEFYPNLSKTQLFTGGFVGGAATSHSSGSAVDVTLVAVPPRKQREYVPGEPLVACTAPVRERFPDNTIDMGTGYDCFDPRSHTLDDRITGQARENRLLLRRLMAVGGFVNYSTEWWHYDLANPPYPGQYFDFPVSRAALP